MSTRTTRKRTRTDVDQDSPDVKPDSPKPATPKNKENATSHAGTMPLLKRDDDFWFNDGTVILQAGDIEFRVYSGLLEGHSTVFEGLFAQRNPTRVVSIAGRDDISCPVIKLSDSPCDVRHVLRSCMPRLAGSLYDVDFSVSFDMISAAIQLGRKYKIIDMSERALEFLRGFYTDSLDTWNVVDGSWCPPDWKDVHAIGVINLARLTGQLSFLPVAFMVCVVRIDGDVVHGFDREDGSKEHLTLEDLRLCFQAKTRLREANIAASFRSLTPTPAPGCSVPPHCAQMLWKAFRGDRIDTQVKVLMHSDVLLHTVANYLTDKEGRHILCPACISMVEERDQKENQALWDRLPELLGIDVPGWPKSAAALAPDPAPAPAPAPGPGATAAT